ASAATPDLHSFPTRRSSDLILKRWKEGPVWVAVQGGRLVGTIAAAAKRRALYIRSMAIVPRARRQGIGKMLLEEVENFAKAAGRSEDHTSELQSRGHLVCRL